MPLPTSSTSDQNSYAHWFGIIGLGVFNIFQAIRSQIKERRKKVVLQNGLKDYFDGLKREQFTELGKMYARLDEVDVRSEKSARAVARLPEELRQYFRDDLELQIRQLEYRVTAEIRRQVTPIEEQLEKLRQRLTEAGGD